MAIFPTFVFRQYRPAKCLLRYFKRKKRVSRLKKQEVKKSKTGKILCNRTRSYRNFMKSLVSCGKDPAVQYHMISYRILQYSRESYRMVQDPMGSVWHHRQTRKDSTARCKILKKWNHTRSYRISQDPRQNPINRY